MAFIALQQGMKFKGELSMFNTKYEYELDILEILPNDEFKFEHRILSNGFIADKKSGDGNYTKVDENIVNLKYKDAETEFHGDLNVNSFEIQGSSTQITGFLTNTQGTFTVNLINK